MRTVLIFPVQTLYNKHYPLDVRDGYQSNFSLLDNNFSFPATSLSSYIAFHNRIFRGLRVYINTYIFMILYISAQTKNSPAGSGGEACKTLNVKKTDEKNSCFVDTAAVVSSMVDNLPEFPTTPPSLFIDLEGANLCHHGSISILQNDIRTTGESYLF
jgi:hypothetical protein